MKRTRVASSRSLSQKLERIGTGYMCSHMHAQRLVEGTDERRLTQKSQYSAKFSGEAGTNV